MRLTFAAVTGALILAMAAASGALPGSGGAGRAEASTGTIKFSPNPRLTAWNADAFSIEIHAQNVVTTTQCATEPNNENSPLAPCGLGAFAFTVNWDPAALEYVGITEGPLLASTGRTIDCFDPVVGTASVQFQCVSFGQIPLGPQGSGSLASLSLRPLVAGHGGSTGLTLTETRFHDIQGNQFPASPLAAGTVNFGICADVGNPIDGGVDLLDVLAILGHFGEVPPSDPKWDPNLDGAVDLGDALYALGQFGQTCTYP